MKLTLIRGIPGSGKSTRAEEIQDSNAVICEADDFFNMNDGTYKFDPKHLDDAHKLCQAEAAYFLFRGNNVIVSNTSIYMRDIKTYWLIAKKYGAEFEIINCVADYGSIHDVPGMIMDKMASAFVPITTEDWNKHVLKHGMEEA